jgi:surface polysaccharide O-acyltransferase-like enzyme
MSAQPASIEKKVQVNVAEARASAGSRLFFVDNIRIFLTVLVILHHLMVIYAGTGDFPYKEGREDEIVNALGGWFCAVNQSYFMGLFLLVSAYFVPGSYDRKGAGRFVKDRLIRLGIPLAIYSWIIDPLFVYARLTMSGKLHVPLWSFYPGQYFRQYGPLIGAGPLWFVETLLIFTLLYVVWRLLSRSRPPEPAAESAFPGNGAIALFALLLGVAGFLARQFFRMDEYFFRPLNLQLPFFAQYIALFVLGLIAYRRNWLQSLPDKTGRLWLRIAVLFILLWAPLMLVGGAITTFAPYRGGWHWQAFVYALWEAFLCVSMCIGLIYAFRRYLNRQGNLVRSVSPAAYTAYLIHVPLITGLAIVLRGIMLYPLLKWALVALVAVSLCFGLSYLIRKLPYADRVL